MNCARGRFATLAMTVCLKTVHPNYDRIGWKAPMKSNPPAASERQASNFCVEQVIRSLIKAALASPYPIVTPHVWLTLALLAAPDDAQKQETAAS